MSPLDRPQTTTTLADLARASYGLNRRWLMLSLSLGLFLMGFVAGYGEAVVAGGITSLVALHAFAAQTANLTIPRRILFYDGVLYGAVVVLMGVSVVATIAGFTLLILAAMMTEKRFTRTMALHMAVWTVIIGAATTRDRWLSDVAVMPQEMQKWAGSVVFLAAAIALARIISEIALVGNDLSERTGNLLAVTHKGVGTPLQAIIGTAEALRDASQDREVRELSDAIIDLGARAKFTVESLTDASDQFEQSAAMTRFDLSSLAREFTTAYLKAGQLASSTEADIEENVAAYGDVDSVRALLRATCDLLATAGATSLVIRVRRRAETPLVQVSADARLNPEVLAQRNRRHSVITDRLNRDLDPLRLGFNRLQRITRAMEGSMDVAIGDTSTVQFSFRPQPKALPESGTHVEIKADAVICENGVVSVIYDPSDPRESAMDAHRKIKAVVELCDAPRRLLVITNGTSLSTDAVPVWREALTDGTIAKAAVVTGGAAHATAMVNLIGRVSRDIALKGFSSEDEAKEWLATD